MFVKVDPRHVQAMKERKEVTHNSTNGACIGIAPLPTLERKKE
jgi:hypothetical protein